jgi:hypothetical protein
METAAPGITAPVGSDTVPLIEPELDWASSLENTAEHTRMNKEKRILRRNWRMDGPPENRCFEHGLLVKDFPILRIGGNAC